MLKSIFNTYLFRTEHLEIDSLYREAGKAPALHPDKRSSHLTGQAAYLFLYMQLCVMNNRYQLHII